jgi:lipid-A-disaccharide synthase
MVLAGEPSGDLLAAELVRALQTAAAPSRLRFFGAGGPQMDQAGVELAVEMTRHAVVGLVEVLKNYRRFKELFDKLIALAFDRRPEFIICVDFSGFNRRFARRIRWELQARAISDWQPRLIQYVSPQVWASRPGRARAMARDFDLLLAIFPFEKAWYASHVAGFPVEFVGHPMLDRYSREAPSAPAANASLPQLALLPGSRNSELHRHLPPMLRAWELIRAELPQARATLVLPNDNLGALARTFGVPDAVRLQVGNLAGTLSEATLAIASTGTVTMECAYFRVPTVAIYKTSWSTYQIGKRIIQVRFLAMPNILANEPLLPELIQHEATGERIAQAALKLLRDPEQRDKIRARLGAVIDTLGGAGASKRAAQSILQLGAATRTRPVLAQKAK